MVSGPLAGEPGEAAGLSLELLFDLRGLPGVSGEPGIARQPDDFVFANTLCMCSPGARGLELPRPGDATPRAVLGLPLAEKRTDGEPAPEAAGEPTPGQRNAPRASRALARRSRLSFMVARTGEIVTRSVSSHSRFFRRFTRAQAEFVLGGSRRIGAQDLLSGPSVHEVPPKSRLSCRRRSDSGLLDIPQREELTLHRG